MNVAVILAGGKGDRFGTHLPKQFAKLSGKPIIEYTIDKFVNYSKIDKVIIVINPKWKNLLSKIVKKYLYKKTIEVIEGGVDRFSSTFNAIKYLENNLNDNDNIIIHDAVRPFINYKILDDCIEKLNIYNAIDTAIDSTDTLIKVNKNKIIDMPNRVLFKRGQTPQCFKFHIIKKAYYKANQNNTFTCDCGVVFNVLKEPIYVVQGSEYNIKITYPLDIFIAEKLIQMGINNSVDLNSINLQQLQNKNILIFGNSSGIGKSIEYIARKYNANVVGISRNSGVDITNINQINQFLKKKNLKFDIVFVTAGILIKKKFDNLEIDEITKQININYIGSINVARAIKPYLKNNSNLIFFASSSYTKGRSEYSIYSSSKSAIVNFTQALAEEWTEDNIKVNCVSPQRTLTPMRLKNFKDDNIEELLLPDEVAMKSLQLGLSNFSGLILDIKKKL